MKKILFRICVIVIFAGCKKDDPNPNGLSNVAINFLNEVMAIMQQNSINKDKIDWNDFRTRMYEKAAGAQEIDETTNGLYEALKMLGDNHSFIVKTDGTSIYAGSLSCSVPAVTKPALPSNIGYVKVGSFSGDFMSSQAIAFARAILDQIKNQDGANITGWIVDLRGNGGGNMWPMIAGIGPILGEGTAGYFDYPNGTYISWGFTNGASVSNGSAVTTMSPSYTLLSPMPKVAVLLDKGIASSGEIVAVSFIARPKTKSFGSATCGLSTVNSNYILSNGWTLYLTSSFQADRNKKRYGVPIQPDMVSTTDSIINDAVFWLNN
ncbi:MAG TPA: S41 family peptidase [Cyclobacteriaceae bacterium]|nr:S41 family peptidase [Cyclobacteriaceae bacterium]